MLQSTYIFYIFYLKWNKILENDGKSPDLANFYMLIVLIFALFPHFWTKAYLCPYPGGGGGCGQNIHRCMKNLWGGTMGGQDVCEGGQDVCGGGHKILWGGPRKSATSQHQV